jgi:hypothetical protein
VLPVLHDALELADVVRRTILDLAPDAVAVEIPSSLERSWLAAVARLPAISVVLYETAAGRTVYLPIHPADPFVEAARSASEAGIGVRCIDLDVDGYADYRDAAPDPYAVLRLGASRLYDAFHSLPRPRDPHDAPREAAMAFHVRRLVASGAKRVLVVCGMHHADPLLEAIEREQAEPLTPPVRRDVRLVHPHPESIPEVLNEVPFYVAAYEARRLGPPPEPPERRVAAGRSHGPFRVLSGGRGDDPDRIARAIARGAAGDGPLDRLRTQWTLLREAEQALVHAAPDEEVRRWQRLLLARYTRKLAWSAGRLVVDLFDLLAAARASVSDNFAWELHRLAIAYPAQAEVATDVPTARIRADEMWDGVRRLRIHRRHRRPKRPDWRTLLPGRRQDERWPGEWLAGFDGETICSFPPEDLVVEDFGRYLRRRGKSVLSEERARTVPFTTSILDGIDVRETIRSWHEGRIMVRELGRSPGEVGSVVVVFDEDREDERYPHLQTWHGEHEQESDMAFYCTDPLQGVVGPGICRVAYGGFLLSYPPRRLGDVWADPDYRLAESKAEVLLLAALDYCAEPVVVYVAARPPRPVLQRLAVRVGLKVLYLPLGSLSPTTLRRVRRMHILSGQDKRTAARDYIW